MEPKNDKEMESEIRGIAQDIIFLMNSETSKKGKCVGLKSLIDELSREYYLYE